MKKKNKPTAMIVAIALILIGIVGLVLTNFYIKSKNIEQVAEEKNIINSTRDNPIILSGKMIEFINKDDGYKILLPEEVNILKSENAYELYYYDKENGEDKIWTFTINLIPLASYQKDFKQTLEKIDKLKVGSELKIPLGDNSDYTLYKKLYETKYSPIVYYKTDFSEAGNSFGYLTSIPVNKDNYLDISLVSSINFAFSIEENNKQLEMQKNLFYKVVHSFELIK